MLTTFTVEIIQAFHFTWEQVALTFSTRPTKHTGLLMCCDSMEQFILGLGTSSMPAILMGCCFWRYWTRDNVILRGKCLVLYFMSHGSPCGRSIYIYVEMPWPFIYGKPRNSNRTPPTLSTTYPLCSNIVSPRKHRRILPVRVGNGITCRRIVESIYSFYTDTEEMEANDVLIITQQYGWYCTDEVTTGD